MANYGEWVGVIASWASIVGLLVSVYVLWEVKRIRKQFLLRIRIKDLHESLQKQASGISRGLNNFEESQYEIGVMFAQCESTLRNFIPKLSGGEKKEIRRLAKSLRRHHRQSWWGKKHNFDIDEAWRVYTELQGIIQRIGHLREDIRWEG